jgi:hypothetical protein
LNGRYFVRVYFTPQTFDQLRELTPPTLEQPPAILQLLIPGSGQADTLDLDCSGMLKMVARSDRFQGCAGSQQEGPLGLG